MKEKLTNNLGLKLISVGLAIILWIIVVSIDDPVITRTFSGIEVEVLNADAVTSQGKTYEILDGSNNIAVSVSAKRSILEKISKDYIKATADLKEMTILNSAAINVRTTRYSDMISSITPLTKNLKLAVEDLDKKQLSITVETIGNPAKGYVVGNNSPSVNITTVTGAASKVSKITRAVATVDVSGRTSNIRTGAEVVLYDGNGDPVNSSSVSVSVKEIVVDVDILETKEISVSATVSGTTAEGFAYTGLVSADPETILVAGSGTTFNNLESIVIPAEDISIEGITEDKSYVLNINDYLPSGIRLADSSFDGLLTVTAYVGKLENALIDIPMSNIFVDNVPEGFTVAFADESGTKRVEVQGLNEVLTNLDASTIMGSIDASSMTPREPVEGEEGFHAGSYDAYVKWNMPSGVTVVGASMIELNLTPATDNNLNLVEPETVLTELPPAEQ
ncbi:MAG: hypothetical protein K6G27_09760 [Lachnospiraceae bacterium]|nr:hypothetical protein [Lachnospiraceae bacterium]